MTTESSTPATFDVNDPLYLGYLDHYQDAAPEPTRLRPGKYFLDLPTTIPVEKRADFSGRVGLEFNIGAAKVVANEDGSPTNGYINRFARVGTLPKGAQQFSDAVDLLELFGVDRSTLTSEEVIKASFEAISGQRTPKAIRLDYQGSYKHPLTQKRVYKKSKDFLGADGEYARVGYVLPTGEFTLTPGFPADVTDAKAQSAWAKANGITVVFANFEPGYRAFAKGDGSK